MLSMIASISDYLQCMNSCQKISKRSVYERSKGWIYQSQISPVIDTMEALNEKIEQTQARYMYLLCFADKTTLFL